MAVRFVFDMIVTIGAPVVIFLVGLVAAFRGPRYNRGFVTGAALMAAIIVFVAITCRVE